MMSFSYRSNPRYEIKECSSCGTLYTRDCGCSKENVEDKILVPKPPKNRARCTRCGYLVDGPNCQGCALLRKELEENLVAHSPDFQNTFEPSNASTNVINAPREPYVVKQDNGSFVDKIIVDLNRALLTHPTNFIAFINSLNDTPSISETSSQSPPNINHCCYECGDPLDVSSNPEPCNNQKIDELPQTLSIFHPTFQSEAESPFTLDSTPTYVDESPNIFNPPLQPPVYPCEFCRNDAYYGHYYTPQAPFIYSKPCYNQDFNFSQDFQTVPQQYPCCDDCGVTHDAYQFVQKKLEEKQLEEERAAKAKYWKLSVCYDDDDDEERSDSLNDNIISGLPSFSAITPDEPVLSTEEPDNSLSMGDEHLDTISAMESNEFIKSGVETLIPIPSESEGIPEHVRDVPFHDNSPPLDVSKDQIEDLSESNEDFSSINDDSFSIDNIDYVEASPPDSELVSSEVMEIVIPEVGGIDDDILLTIEHNVLREKLLNVNLLIAKIEALNANPTPPFDCKTKSSSTSLNSLLEETKTFDNSLPEFETFCFDVEEISSGSTTTHPDISLPEYEVFYDDHVKEISSGSPTTHSDSSLYASFMFDLSINPFTPIDRSDSYEFTDELILFISAPEYDCFLFKVEPNSGDFTKDVVDDISPTKEPQVLNALPTHPTLQLNTKFQPSSESLFAYVVWIFLPFLVYLVAPHYLLSLRTEDIIFDPGICKSTFSRPDISHRCGTVKNFNTHRSHLNKCSMLFHGQNNPPLDVLLPDIVHATCLCARYQAKLTEKHLNEVKRIFRYLRGTINTGLWYMKDIGFELTGFLDADYAGCKDSFKSTSGGAQFLGEKLVSWSSRKQDCMTLSTAKAEYVSLSACCVQVLWMRTQLTDYGFNFTNIPIYCDSKSAIAISCNPVQHSRTKHIAVRYHFIKEHVEKGTIELYFIKTDYQLADIFTKALPADHFNYLVRRL
nr:copia protein [Tanacetum cinerariifolium]